MYITQLLVALSSVILFAVHGIQQLMVVWFSVIILTPVCCYYCFPVIVSCTHGIRTAACHIRPYKQVGMLHKLLKIIEKVDKIW